MKLTRYFMPAASHFRTLSLRNGGDKMLKKLQSASGGKQEPLKELRLDKTNYQLDTRTELAEIKARLEKIETVLKITQPSD